VSERPKRRVNVVMAVLGVLSLTISLPSLGAGAGWDAGGAAGWAVPAVLVLSGFTIIGAVLASRRG